MQALFPQLPFGVRAALKALPRAINEILPLRTAHKRDLPLAVEELSLRLTSERNTLNRPYWSAPRLTSAYIRYFLPWNIIRLTRLFVGLPLPEPKALAPSPAHEQSDGPSTEPLPRLLVDVGAGPLTVPIALWMAKPQWRDLPLTVLCLDSAPQPLDLGKKLFLALAGEHSPWRIITRRAPLDALPRELRSVRGIPWLLTAANVINEIPVKNGQFNDERFAAIADVAAHFCQHPEASALFVEPGTRLGGKNMVSLREQALEMGLKPVAPCPHAAACPVQESRSWCHFTFDIDGAPEWLLELSRQAHLTKDGLSMSFMLLQKNAPAPKPPQTHPELENVRIISAPFIIPGMWGSSRYACSERGLTLLTDALSFPSGALIEAQWPEEPKQDKKSGAFIISPYKPKGELIMRSVPRKGQVPSGKKPHTTRPQH
ncbi:MAG: small ribosomal subunit Rsm22 family protein [Desulfovibrionaceae bacterium]